MARGFLPRTLRSALQLLVVAAIAPGFLFVIWWSVREYRSAERRAYATVQQATRLAVREHESHIESTRVLLQASAERTRDLAPDEMCDAFAGTVPAAQATTLVADHPSGAGYEFFCAASRGGPESGPLSAAAVRAVEAAAETGQFAAGGYTVSSGASRLAVAQPLTVHEGRQRYAVTFVPLDWFSGLASTLNLPEDSAMTIVGSDAGVLARHPDPEQRGGTAIAAGELFALISGSASEGAGGTAGIDGIRRLYAFARLAQYGSEPIYLAVGVPSASVFRDAAQGLWWSVGGLIAVSLLGLVIAHRMASRFVLRRASALTSVAHRIAGGDFSARAGDPGGADEMSALARALDQMAANMEHSHKIEQRSYAELREKEIVLRASKHALEAQRLNLDRLSQELLRVQEKERQHIARELHDEIGQNLTALKINLQIEQGGRPQSVFLAEGIRIVERLLAEIRQLALTLRPPLLDEQGLRSATAYLLRAESERSGLRTVHRISIGDARYPSEIELAVFRIIQEALTNVTRHAQASEVVVTLDERRQALKLSVEDDGAGFDVKRTVAGRGFGLLSMRERAELIGGRLDIESVPGAGTTINARIPLPSQVNPEA